MKFAPIKNLRYYYPSLISYLEQIRCQRLGDRKIYHLSTKTKGIFKTLPTSWELNLSTMPCKLWKRVIKQRQAFLKPLWFYAKNKDDRDLSK